MKRSYEKRITKEATVLRYLRHMKKLSLNQTGRLVGITGSAVAHIEQGRMDISRARLLSFLSGFGVTQDAFIELMESGGPLTSPHDECISIIKQLDETKLQAVLGILVNFMPPRATPTAQVSGRNVALR